MVNSLFRNRRSFWQRIGIERQPRCRARGSPVRPGEPIAHMKQFTHCHQRVGLLDCPMAMHGLIAQRIDDPRLAEHRFARRGLEARLVDERAQVVLVGQFQRSVGFVRPRHPQLKGTPGVEACGARIGIYRSRGLAGGLVHGGPLSLQEGEVARGHGLLSASSACVSRANRSSNEGGLLRNMGCIAA